MNQKRKPCPFCGTPMTRVYVPILGDPNLGEQSSCLVCPKCRHKEYD